MLRDGGWVAREAGENATGGTPQHGQALRVTGAQGSSLSRRRLRVPGKVNLFLAIRGLRNDGYHELVTVLQTVSLFDTITVDMTGDSSASHPAARRFMALSFSAEGPEGLPDGDDNLAVRAARRLMGVAGIGTAEPREDWRGPVTRLHLTKQIPMAAGMAGGSADAAATLIALNELGEAGLDRRQLAELAAELGADVPFCVNGGTALATGIGTATAQVLTRGTYHWVIGMADQGLSTPAVFRRFDEVAAPSAVEPDAVLQALRTADAEALGAALYNDLDAAAFHLRPQLRAARDAMLAAGALGAILSGSGPTIVALAANRPAAQRIAAEAADHFSRIELAMSPAGGPETVRD